MASRIFALACLALSAVAESIPAAEHVSNKSSIVPGPLKVTEHTFKVPLDYSDPDGESITLFGRSVTNYKAPIIPADDDDEEEEASEEDPLPWMVFLAGGPGFGNPAPQDHVLTSTALERGYQVLYLDHRGTGLSTPVSTQMLDNLDGGEDAQVAYLRLMRQDNTVRDCEAVRKALTKGLSKNKAKWSIFGQSYGGFISLSYLSLHPEGLREVYLTGGLAPVGRTAQEVYEALFPRIKKRNELYYEKYPEDIETVHEIVEYITEQGGSIDLATGGKLTVPRLMSIGIEFGGAGGFQSVHNALLAMKLSLDQLGYLSRASLSSLTSIWTLDDNIIYAILHEAIYCDGPDDVSNWASDRVARELGYFPWLPSSNSTTSSAKSYNTSEPLLFTGENIFPFYFDVYPELKPLKSVANKLAAVDDWEKIYDKDQLKKNKVPVYAASYLDDSYVDYEYAKDTAALVKGVKTWETNAYQHSGLRSNTADVLGALFKLKDDVKD